MIVPMVIAFSLTILLFGFRIGFGERTKSIVIADRLSTHRRATQHRYI